MGTMELKLYREKSSRRGTEGKYLMWGEKNVIKLEIEAYEEY